MPWFTPSKKPIEAMGIAFATDIPNPRCNYPPEKMLCPYVSLPTCLYFCFRFDELNDRSFLKIETYQIVYASDVGGMGQLFPFHYVYLMTRTILAVGLIPFPPSHQLSISKLLGSSMSPRHWSHSATHRCWGFMWTACCFCFID